MRHLDLKRSRKNDQSGRTLCSVYKKCDVDVRRWMRRRDFGLLSDSRTSRSLKTEGYVRGLLIIVCHYDV